MTSARGASLVHGGDRPGTGETFRARDPHTGAPVGPVYGTAGDADVDDAVSAAAATFDRAEGAAPLAALAAVADLLEGRSAALVAVAMEETGLGAERLSGEVKRTSGQLRFMAELARRGERVDATIDHADPGSGRPDLRRVGMPIGPVAVFGASNFPFAFSVLGGDTASALAAGCPVVVKAHESHPETSELCGRLMVEALSASGCDQGWFALLQGRSRSLGQALVTALGIRAVGFTGSLQGGRALFDAANRRPDPVPVYAEMGSLNPVFVTARAAQLRAREIAEMLATSLTASAGQLCTKPNLIVVPEGPEGDELCDSLVAAFSDRPAQPLLNESVRDGLVAGLREASSLPGVDALGVQCIPVSPGRVADGAGGGFTVPGTLLSASLEGLLAHEQLRTEHFGPAAVIVRCPDDDYARVAACLEGSLTATVHLEDDEAPRWGQLVQLLTGIAGRVIVNGVPTGVAVNRAVHHGGPYPSTTSARDTSVGAAAIDRWLRPVCFQDVPDALLPAALQDANPLRIWRRVDGELTPPA